MPHGGVKVGTFPSWSAIQIPRSPPLCRCKICVHDSLHTVAVPSQLSRTRLHHVQKRPDPTCHTQRSEQPTAAAFLNLTLETKTQLVDKYKVPMFSSCEEMLADAEALEKIDGECDNLRF